MRTISAAELSVLAGELKEFAGFYIEKFYETGEGGFRMKLKKEKAQANLQIILSHTINRTSYVERQGQPSSFAMAVRKRIEGFRIDSISQMGNDRIVVFALDKGDARLNLIVEMFGKGNFIIADSSMNILLAYRQHQFRERAVAKNIEYKPPRQAEGYAAEVPEAVKPVVFMDEKGKAIDYSIGDAERHGDMKRREFQKLQDALDAFYVDNPVGAREVGERALEKQLGASIEKQRRLIKGAESEIETNKEIAEKIFNNMDAINRIIDELKRNKRMTKEELQQRAEGIKIADVDLKDKKVTIDVD